jgi:hypothetical protein
MSRVKKGLCLAILLLGTGCRTDLFLGKVEGVAATVYAPNGRTPAYRAAVAVADVKAGGYYGKAVTSPGGYFAIAGIPDGTYRIEVTSANRLFKTSFHADVLDGYSAGGIESLLAPVRAETIADIRGRYDDMGTIFGDLGYRYRTLDVEILAQPENPLRDMDIVCLNSGVDAVWAEDDNVTKNLRSFVEKGGRLIVSDQAWPFLKASWPEKISWRTDPAIGKPQQEVDGGFADADMKRCATIPKWRLRYDFGGWAVPSGTTGAVFIVGDVETSVGTLRDAPLLVGFGYGQGFVIFSTFDWRTQYAQGRLAVRIFNYLIANM